MKLTATISKWLLPLTVLTGAAQSQPVYFTHEHVDLRIVEQPSETHQFGLVIYDAARRLTFQPDDAVLVVSEAAKLELPPGTPFGQAGDPIWILPQTLANDVLFLGLSAEAVGSAFSSIRLYLRSISGPGNFFLWQYDAGFQIRMDTTDGISDEDHTPVIVGSHAHFNWGFTAPGKYQLEFQVSGERSNELLWSPETMVTFHVLPLPDLNPFQEWQQTHWPEGAPEAVQGPDADPDEDGIVNLVEYALGLDPKFPGREGLPRFAFLQEGEATVGAFLFARPESADDLVYEVWVADDLGTAHWQPLNAEASIMEQGGTELITIRDPAAAAASQRFYQLRIRFR